ncbi:dTDP-glucose 4,6-dehydratase [Afipia sp. DC4300-2b1]|uniref:dTDP-glucose 4,6-dehydratase n=1 Tax=Afipia sp. DC4300-2b1 TaxID=2804672 RepID=UPI003CE7BB4C
MRVPSIYSHDKERPILVTGGAGFIGTNFILDWLKTEKAPIINLDKLTYAGNLENFSSVSPDSRIEFIRGDIDDTELVRAILKRARPQAILNFAAESHVDRSIRDPSDFIDTNIVGTFKLLECARDYWERLRGEEGRVFRFLQISTDEVYGSLEPSHHPFTEENAFLPSSPYAASKAAADHLVRAWHKTYGLPVLTTNCSNNYGPYQFPEKLIPLMIIRALSGEQLPIYGDGMHSRDWLYVADHCAAVRTVLRAGRLGEIYNIGGRNEKTNRSIVLAVCAMLDAEIPRVDEKSYCEQIRSVQDRPGHDRRYAIDSSKIESELGWLPQEVFESGLRKTVRWYLSNRDWLARTTSRSHRE